MTDYLLTTSVRAEALSPVFEEAVRVTCRKDYTSAQVEVTVCYAFPLGEITLR